MLANVLDNRSGCAALVGLFVLLLLTLQIRPPNLSGSLIDQVSAGVSGGEASAAVRAARGAFESTFLIFAPEDTSIGASLDQLTAFGDGLRAIDTSIATSSPLSAVDQLFVFGLTRDDPLAALLSAFRDEARTAAVIGRQRDWFAVVISAPESAGDAVLETIAAFEWGRPLRRHWVFSTRLLTNEVVAELRQDLRVFLPVIGFMLLAALALAFRPFIALLLPAAAALSGAIVVFSVVSLLGVAVNLVSLLAFPIVLIVAIANCCHFLASAAASKDRRDSARSAVVTTLRQVTPGFVLSSVTTALAFASLAFNDLEPIAALGRVAAISLILVLALTILFAPWCLHKFLRTEGTSVQTSRPYRTVAAALHKGGMAIVLGLVVVSAVGIVALPNLKLQSDPRAFFPDDGESATALAVLETEFFAFTPIGVVIQPKDETTDPVDVLRAAGELRRRLQLQPEVIQATLEPAREIANAFLLTALVDSYLSLAGVRAAIDEFRPPTATPVSILQSDLRSVYAAVDKQAFESLRGSLLWSAILILLAISIAFRSLPAVFAAVIVNLVPLAAVCAMLWFDGGTFNIVSALVFVVALGIIVDDTAHVLFWLRHGRTLENSSLEFSMLFSSILLCAGLALFMLSDFETTRRFALYSATAVLVAVLADLKLLPTLVRITRRPAA